MGRKTAPRGPRPMDPGRDGWRKRTRPANQTSQTNWTSQTRPTRPDQTRLMPCQIFATDQTRLTIPWLRPSLRDFGEARTPISPPPRLRRGDDDDAYDLRRSRGGPGLLQGPRRTSVSIRFQPRRRAGPPRARKPRPNLGANLKTGPGPLPGSRAGVLSAYPFLCRQTNSRGSDAPVFLPNS